MTTDRASVEEALRLWNEVYDANESYVRSIPKLKPAIDLFPELARELQRLWRVEEAATRLKHETQLWLPYSETSTFTWEVGKALENLLAALANPAAEEGDG